jgi:hypothetical protein
MQSRFPVWWWRGVVLILGGITFHSLSPSTINSGLKFFEAESAWTIELSTETPFSAAEYDVYLYFNFFPTQRTNYTIYIIPTDLIPSVNLSDPIVLAQNSISVDVEQTWFYPEKGYYLCRLHANLLSNEQYTMVYLHSHVEQLIVFYQVSVIPNWYFIGWMFAAIGTGMLCIGYYRSMTGWKKLWVLGVGINLIAFFVRVAIMPLFLDLEANMGEFIDTELYNDFVGLYLPWTEKIMDGVFPYSEMMPGYIYSPLFVYIITAMRFTPLPCWNAAIPIFLATIGIGYLIFKILLFFTNREEIAGIGMLFYFINPFVLVYGSFMWLNPPVFLFFILLAIYLLIREKPGYAMLALGLGTMIKQFTILYLPLFLIVIFHQKGDQKFWHRIWDVIKAGVLWAIPVAVLSIPFLLIDAPAYFQRVWIGNASFSISHYLGHDLGNSFPMTFITLFRVLNFPSWILYPAGYLLILYIPFMLWLGNAYIRYFFKFHTQPTASRVHMLQELVFWAFIVGIGIQLFYARGSYKYYLIGIAPFLVLLYLFQVRPLEDDQDFPEQYLYPVLFGTALSWLILFFERNFYLLLILCWGIYLLRKHAKLQKKTAKS